MDSGNSGSMQSSSCGDEIEDYDSRADSNNFSALLNNQPPPTTRINHVLNTTSHPSSSSSSIPQQQQHQMFDPLVNYYMDSLQKASPSSNQNQNQNSFLNLDMMWAKATGRSEQNNTDLSSLMVPSSSSSSSQQNHHHHQQAFLLSQLTAGQTRENVASVPTTHQHQHQQHHSLPQESTSRGGISLTNDQQNLNNNNMGRNPKKRSRASRRAPTTVLTTDTTNFRAMVQEFTGIPAPPFSSPFPRTRLDLFGSSVSSRSLSSQMDPPLHQAPPYLLRPFAQKIQPQPQPQPQPHYSFSQIPSSSFPSLENLASNNSTNSASINYHNHPLMQHNQILGFQSISSPTKYPHGPQQPSLEISPKMGVFEELGLSHANNNIGVVHQQNMVPASSERVNNNNNNMRNTTSEDQWGQRTSSTSINGDNDGGGGRILGSLSGIQERNSNASVEKGQECGVVVATTTRGEGTVESWINCSSSD